MTLDNQTKAFDRQEASDVLSEAQTAQLADYRHENTAQQSELEELRGKVARLEFDAESFALKLSEIQAMVNSQSKIIAEQNDDAYRYFDEAVNLCGVLQSTLSSHRLPIGALEYFSGILRYYREKFHAPNYGDDILF